MCAVKKKKSEEFDSMVMFAEPPMYKVILLNDDYTPMDFVVMVLKDVFHQNQRSAERIMLNIHNNGSGLCGIYTYEVAEAKVGRVVKLASDAAYPLRCTMEEE